MRLTERKALFSRPITGIPKKDLFFCIKLYDKYSMHSVAKSVQILRFQTENLDGLFKLEH